MLFNCLGVPKSTKNRQKTSKKWDEKASGKKDTKKEHFSLIFNAFWAPKPIPNRFKKRIEKHGENIFDLFTFFKNLFPTVVPPLLELLPFRGLRPPDVQRLERFP